ncbi:MAG: hypothetical protein R2754_06060 [Microthrixaceae bacterium]
MAGSGQALPADRRPIDPTPVHTDALPPTPIRDRNIPANAWIEAPASVLHAGADLPGAPPALYKRRIGGWLLWRAGPATKADARYVAVDADDLEVAYSYRLFPDGSGTGTGPTGATHDRFRSWKEDLRDHDGASHRLSTVQQGEIE